MACGGTGVPSKSQASVPHPQAHTPGLWHPCSDFPTSWVSGKQVAQCGRSKMSSQGSLGRGCQLLL